MRLRLIITISVLTMGFIGLFDHARAAEAAQTNAPTGLYISLLDIPERFTVDLKTNGVYSVLAAGVRTNSQTGVWKWDDVRRQFLLTPRTNSAFGYQLRVLRVDPRQPETLQWIPLGAFGQAGGAIDYVRFKRKVQ